MALLGARRLVVLSSGGGLSISSPLQLPDLQLWLRADAGTWQDSVGGTPASADTDAVGAWADQSGNDRTLSEATNKPALRTNVQNSLPAVRFDGTNDKLAASFTLTQPYTLFVVAKWIAIPGDFETLVDGVLLNRGRIYAYTDGDVALNSGTELRRDFNGATAIHVYAAIFSGTASSLRVDGSGPTSGNAGTAAPGGVSLAVRGSGDAEFGNVDVYEVVLYSGALGQASIDAVEQYLGTRWGIAVA